MDWNSVVPKPIGPAFVTTTVVILVISFTIVASCSFGQKISIPFGKSGLKRSNNEIDMYLDLLEKAVTGSLYNNILMNENTTENDFKLDDRRFRGNDWPGQTGHTMVGNLRIRNIKETLLDVITSSVEGDFAEFGVWRGGSCIYAAG